LHVRDGDTRAYKNNPTGRLLHSNIAESACARLTWLRAPVVELAQETASLAAAAAA
jgi:hypothetical protein